MNNKGASVDEIFEEMKRAESVSATPLNLDALDSLVAKKRAAGRKGKKKSKGKAATTRGGAGKGALDLGLMSLSIKLPEDDEKNEESVTVRGRGDSGTLEGAESVELIAEGIVDMCQSAGPSAMMTNFGAMGDSDDESDDGRAEPQSSLPPALPAPPSSEVSAERRWTIDRFNSALTSPNLKTRTVSSSARCCIKSCKKSFTTAMRMERERLEFCLHLYLLFFIYSYSLGFVLYPTLSPSYLPSFLRALPPPPPGCPSSAPSRSEIYVVVASALERARFAPPV